MRPSDMNWSDFWAPALVGAGVGLVVAIMISIPISVEYGTEKDRRKEHERQVYFKETLFLAAAGQPNEVDSGDNTALAASELGQYLANEYEDNVKFIDVLRRQRKLLVINSSAYNRSALLRIFENLEVNMKIPEHILVIMEKDWRWKSILRNEKDFKVLESLLIGKGEIPKSALDLQQNPPLSLWSILGPLFFIFIQIGAFIVYLIDCCNDDDIVWHEVPWNKPRTYVAMLVFISVGLPILAFGLIKLVKTSYATNFSRGFQPENKFMYISTDKLNSQASSPGESRKLLEKLQKKLIKET